MGQTPWWHGYVTTFGLIGTHPDRDALSTSRAAVTASPERCSDLRARVLDTMMLLLATTCFVHAHDVSQGRSRRASRRAVCLTPVVDAAEAQNNTSTKAAREVLTTDAMNHLVSFGPCINSCRLPALAPIHSPCPEWSCNVCLYPAPCPCTRSGVRHVVCVSSCPLRSHRPRMSPRVCLLQFVTNICVVMHRVMVIVRTLFSRCIAPSVASIGSNSSATHSETVRSL